MAEERKPVNSECVLNRGQVSDEIAYAVAAIGRRVRGTGAAPVQSQQRPDVISSWASPVPTSRSAPLRV